MFFPANSGRRASSPAAHSAAPAVIPGENALGAHEQARGRRRASSSRTGTISSTGAAVKVLWHKVRADAHQTVGACLAAAEQRGGGGLDRSDMDRGLLLLEIAGGAADGAAVPTPATKASTCPSRSDQISGPVVR